MSYNTWIGTYDPELDRKIGESMKDLEAKGHVVGDAVVRVPGHVMLYKIDDVFMFGSDVIDLANGTSTMDEIISRNKGKVFPDAAS